ALIGKIFRIGHLGAVTLRDVVAAVGVLEEAGLALGLAIEAGVGVAASQKAGLAVLAGSEPVPAAAPVPAGAR
ncbi:MAG: hypothetical protein ACXWMU_06595, partial [Candidatus Limnocylindrales bacterium]